MTLSIFPAVGLETESSAVGRRAPGAAGGFAAVVKIAVIKAPRGIVRGAHDDLHG
jgi:hypothetical protein